ncbi:putative toxin-antitoxin system toxin component, PIN family [Roseateles koreensis]|uniref:Toxin-antitoxin system toxin component, PIN family n=1 Tax=Roseateles koreensis TaxID=2987526 RepID=A0ABT5KV27_9BURK|nr:putative toxin-antitoxin system toxin component, PIN family [Roseateles koreensis]MDC8786764.1 putative toxin-antitoxin system toxin component, PIN family [Roseateles koreensis]
MCDSLPARATAPAATTADIPTLVIDTQVVMDWLVFNDARVQTLVQALTEKKVRWLGQAAMLDEILHVLGRGVAASYGPDPLLVTQGFAQYCEMTTVAPPRAERLICRDRDDQMFIDLAVAVRARWLVSRDRAVLALAKRARAFGVDILTPERWTAEFGTTLIAPATCDRVG